MIHHNHRILSLWMLSISILVVVVHNNNNPFCSSYDSPTTAKNCRRRGGGVTKAEKKLTTTIQTLIVDANNVRGIGRRFEWNPLQLQQRIVACSKKFGIETTIIVWDHGNSKSAIPFFIKSQDVTTNNIDTNNNRCTTIVLFSGLFHRADDLIVEEAKHISNLKCKVVYNIADNDTTKSGFDSLGFVTNDGGLISRLLRRRQHHLPGGKNHNEKKKNQGASSTSDNNNNNNGSVGKPMMIDSTSYVDILSSLSNEELHIIGGDDSLQKVNIAMNVTLESIREFVTTRQRQGVWNPRREKTWERCVLAESFRQSLCRQQHQQESIICHDETFQNSDLLSMVGCSPFIDQYLLDLKNRGYLGLEEIIQQQQLTSTVCNEINGPPRLDKRQRRLLGRYNAFRKKEKE